MEQHPAHQQQPVDQQQPVQQQLMQQQLMQQQLMQQQPVQQRIILQRPLQPGGPPRYHDTEEQKARRRRVYIMRGIKERAGLLRGDIPHPDGHPSAGVLPSRSYHPEEQINNRYARTRWNDFGTQIAQARYGGGNANKGYDITLESIIAAGGFGIAALVRHRSTRDWVRKLCVMKVERSKFRDKPYMDQEEMALKRFQGAKHIVQYLDRTQEIKNQRDAENAEKRAYIPRKTTEEMDKSWDIKQQRDRRFIIVEYAEGGNLDQWLAKSSRSGKPWPNKALWLLFKCLVKGLIGMGYPPKKIYADDPNFDPNHPVDETIPKEGFAMENTAHFDLDPLNILVAKDEEHGDMPIFKIADFGNAVFFDDQEKTPEKFTKEAFWRYRYRGKTHTLAPEQFDKSWDSMLDFIDDISPNQFVAKDGSKPSVAGNYGMHTNVYQIGLIMWCAITRSWFESPVVAAWYPDYNRASGFRTYGASLQSKRFTKVDEALKIIIQRCMAHNPADRPPLDALKKIIDSRLKLNGLESDEEVSNWAKEFFDSPRCPGDEVDPPTRRWKRTRPHDEDDEEYWRASQRLKTEHEDDVQPDPKLHIPRVPLDSRVAQFPVAGFQPGGPMYQQPMPQQAQQQAPEGFQPRVPSIGAVLGGNNWANGSGYQQQQQQQQFQPQLQPFHGVPLNQGLQQGQQLNPGANVFQPQQQQPQQQYPQVQNPPLQYQQVQDPQQRVLQFQTPQPQFESQFQWPVLRYLQEQPQPQQVQDQQPQYNQVQQPQYLQGQQQQYAQNHQQQYVQDQRQQYIQNQQTQYPQQQQHQYQQPQYQQPQYPQPQYQQAQYQQAQQQQHQYQQAQYQQPQYHKNQQQQYGRDQEPQYDGFQQYHVQ